jgi:hypothetical protein
MSDRPFSAWERALAVRYLRAKRNEGGVALISIISFVGILLAVSVLIIVMSVMNGFRTQLTNEILGFNGHVYVSGPAINGPGRDDIVQRLRAVPGVVEAVPLVEVRRRRLWGRPDPGRRAPGRHPGRQGRRFCHPDLVFRAGHAVWNLAPEQDLYGRGRLQRRHERL